MARLKDGLRAVRRRIAPASPGAPAAAASAQAGHPDADLLESSPLFDDVWYALCADRKLTRRQAVEHYLASPRVGGISPHPLFDPLYAAANLRLDLTAYRAGTGEVDDALVVYLRERAYDVATHPFLELDRYLESYPEAVEHPDGPLGHYRQVGAPAGAQVNGWYRPDPAAEPAGVEAPVLAEARAWVQRRRVARPAWGPPRAPAIAATAEPFGGAGLTSVVLVVENPAADVIRSVESVLAQTVADWELLVVPVAAPLADELVPTDPRLRVLPVAATSWAARNAGLAEAQGAQVAWMSAGDRWVPGRLDALLRAFVESGSVWAHDGGETEREGRRPRPASRRMTRERMLAGAVGELSTVITSTEAVRALGGFDESLPGGQALDLLLRLSADAEGGFARGLGVTMQLARNRAWRPHPFDRPWVDYDKLVSAPDVVLNRHLVDWDGLATRTVEPGTVSVLIPTYEDWQMTELAVRRVVEARTPELRVEVIVVDNGCGVVPATILDALPRQYDDVVVVRAAVNYGFALGNNLGLEHAHGATVVFLNNDTEVHAGWLEPLVAALRDPEVLGAQSLLIYPDGSIQSAGVVFPRGGGLPHVLLQQFPVEDAANLASVPLHALTGAALAMRFTDVVALRGFDPIFRNGMEDVDICLRLAETRPGRFVAVPESRVTHHESKTPGRFARYAANRRVLMDRWTGRLPQDDVAAWAACGFEVTGHRFVHGGLADRRLLVAEPVLGRRPRAEVSEGVPSLRWAIKNPAPSGPKGDVWGDTHFAAQLAAALRDLGQEVVIDRLGAFERTSEWHDDVVLLLRGLGAYTPVPDRVNLTWLISHPDLVERTSHLGWDRIYVASAPFAETMRTAWGAPAVLLPQATDPAVFHPDLAEQDTGAEVLFIGNSRGQARPLVMAAVEKDLPLRVYGAGWDDLIPARYVAGSFLPNDQVGAAYRSARVILNDHWADMARDGFLSNRLFDAVAAGARVISDHVEGIEEIFGPSVQVVHDADELDAIVRRDDLDALFGTDEQRRARAGAIAAEHSFAARARFMLDDALRIRSERGLP